MVAGDMALQHKMRVGCRLRYSLTPKRGPVRTGWYCDNLEASFSKYISILTSSDFTMLHELCTLQ